MNKMQLVNETRYLDLMMIGEAYINRGKSDTIIYTAESNITTDEIISNCSRIIGVKEVTIAKKQNSFIVNSVYQDGGEIRIEKNIKNKDEKMKGWNIFGFLLNEDNYKEPLTEIEKKKIDSFKISLSLECCNNLRFFENRYKQGSNFRP